MPKKSYYSFISHANTLGEFPGFFESHFIFFSNFQLNIKLETVFQ